MWSNGKIGQASIAKRLDRFLMYTHLFGVVRRYRSWVVPSNVSNYMPIFLQLELGSNKIKYPFKFYPIWLGEEVFVHFIKEKWNAVDSVNRGSSMKTLMFKLKNLKSKVVFWERNVKKDLKKELVQIEVELERLYLDNLDRVLSRET